MVGRQRLLLEDVEPGAGELAGPERDGEVVEPCGHAAPDVDEEGRALHPLEARPVHEALGRRRMRHGEDDEIGARQKGIERLGTVKLHHAGRRIPPARVHPDHPHPEGGGEPRGLRADPAHAHHERRGLGQVDDPGVERRRAPHSLELSRQVQVQPAREGQEEGHDVRADMVIVDLAEIGHDRRVRDQLRVVPPGGRRRLGRLDPAEPRGLLQEPARHGAVRGLRLADGPRHGTLVLGDDHGEPGKCHGEPLGPIARSRCLRRQHEESRGHGASRLRESVRQC